MEVANIEIEKLYVSPVNVRKTLSGEEDETGINDLANDIYYIILFICNMVQYAF